MYLNLNNLPNNIRIEDNSLLWTPLNYSETFLLFVFGFAIYNDQVTAWSLFRPQVHLCNCQNGGTCTTDGVLQYDDFFVLLECLCTPGNWTNVRWTECIHQVSPLGYVGDFCEDKIDDCLFVSCLDGEECVKDERTMSVACPCPSGYVEFDSKCVDIDECTNTYHDCHHHCINMPGSYMCSCNEGFELAEDERSCEGMSHVCLCVYAYVHQVYSCMLVKTQASVKRGSSYSVPKKL